MKKDQGPKSVVSVADYEENQKLMRDARRQGKEEFDERMRAAGKEPYPGADPVEATNRGGGCLSVLIAITTAIYLVSTLC
jgi:hypothetical protein